MDFQQSQTFINLQNAYEYQLQASAKYNMFSYRAIEEDLIEISNLFDTTSINERFIAQRLRRILYGGDTDILHNLREASADENAARVNIYQAYSQIAREEGYDDIASLFNGISNIKMNHSFAFDTVINEIENNELFCKKKEALWVCLGCGHILSGLCAPEVCPICGYPQGFYQLLRYIP